MAEPEERVENGGLAGAIGAEDQSQGLQGNRLGFRSEGLEIGNGEMFEWHFRRVLDGSFPPAVP